MLGLLAAAAAGVEAYRRVGPYGDGFANVGLWRMRDPETGRHLFYRDIRSADGSTRRYIGEAGRPLERMRVVGQIAGRPEALDFYIENGKLAGLGRDTDGDGRADVRDYYTDGLKLVKQGFSVGGTGIIDAWQYRNARGEVERIEVARQQDGVVDRWEYYEAGQLTRVEEDNERDGKPDRWLTYDAGILIHEARDRNRDGQPDSRP